MTWSDRLSTWVATVLLAVLGLGLALLPLETPQFTAWLSSRYSQAEAAGISRAEAGALAEQVRAFVVAGQGWLPGTYAGRPAFDAGMVSHLEDVRDVLASAHVATTVLAVLLSLFAWMTVRRRHVALLGDVLVRAGWLLVGTLAAVAIVGLTSFDAFFSAFHRLFFAAGTWTFPYDSLLIRLFPEGFWATAAAAWGALIVAIAAAFVLVGRRFRRHP